MLEFAADFSSILDTWSLEKNGLWLEIDPAVHKIGRAAFGFNHYRFDKVIFEGSYDDFQKEMLLDVIKNGPGRSFVKERFGHI